MKQIIWANSLFRSFSREGLLWPGPVCVWRTCRTRRWDPECNANNIMLIAYLYYVYQNHNDMDESVNGSVVFNDLELISLTFYRDADDVDDDATNHILCDLVFFILSLLLLNLQRDGLLWVQARWFFFVQTNRWWWYIL